MIDPFGAAQSLEYNVQLADGETPLTKNLLKALKEVYERTQNPTNEVLQKELFEVSYNALSSAVTQGFGSPNFRRADLNFVWQLHKSARFFVARKTALQVTQLIGLIADVDRGTRRPFREFKKLAKGIVGNYNQTWLKTEYDTAVAAARSARDWKTYEDEADLYPNIEYLRTVSADPDPDHLKYVGIIRPLNDPFWNTHKPPSRWGCKCRTKNTAAPVTEIPADIDAIDPIVPAFQNNPGKTGSLFNLPYTSYAQNTTQIPDAIIAKELKTRILPELDMYIPAYSFPNGGELLIHPGIDEDEWTENTSLGTMLALNGKKIKLLPIRFIDKVKSPDAKVNGISADFKFPKSGNVIKAITRQVEEANDDGHNYVIIDLRRYNLADSSALERRIPSCFFEAGKDIYNNVEKVGFAISNNKYFEVTRDEAKNRTYLPKLRQLFNQKE